MCVTDGSGRVSIGFVSFCSSFWNNNLGGGQREYKNEEKEEEYKKE